MMVKKRDTRRRRLLVDLVNILGEGATLSILVSWVCSISFWYVDIYFQLTFTHLPIHCNYPYAIRRLNTFFRSQPSIYQPHQPTTPQQ